MTILDGYNIINSWKSLLDAKSKGLAYAREKLIHDMTQYKDFTGEEVSIVFDGIRKLDFTIAEHIDTGVIVIFSRDGGSADAAIERMVYKLKDKSKTLVVTSDRMIRSMIEGMGARSISAENFEMEMKQEYSTT